MDRRRIAKVLLRGPVPDQPAVAPTDD